MSNSPSTFTKENLNFQLPAQQRACFYEDIDLKLPTRTVEVFVHSISDMQVQLAIYGPLEYKKLIDEKFEDPIKTETITEAKEKESETQTFTLEFQAQDAGTYAFCLDNRAAHFFPKQVEISISSATPKRILESAFDPAKQPDDKELGDALKLLGRIHKGIYHLQVQQQRDRHRLALHSAMNEKNYNNAFYGSVIEPAIFVLVMMIQVYFNRRWFVSKTSGSAAKKRAP